MSAWSIQHEIRTATGADDAVVGLRLVAVLRPDETVSEWNEPDEWQRGGAESYIFPFEIRTSSGRRKRLILKAFTPTPSGTGLEEQFEHLLKRRTLLSEAGVRVPTLYFAHRAAVLEDFIESGLRERLDSGLNAAEAQALLAEALLLGRRLDRLGFRPICVADDLRTDGQAVFLVDFGEDLGAPHAAATTTSFCVQQIRHWVEARCSNAVVALLEQADEVAAQRFRQQTPVSRRSE